MTMNIWHDMKPDLVRKEEYTIFTASSMGSTARMSFDGETGLLCLDHLSDTHIGIPNNIGFLPRSYTEDGLPAETILLCSQPLPAMTLVRCRPVGIVVLHLENRRTKEYLISAACADEFWSACLTVDEIPTANRKAIVRYLRYDQQLQRCPVTSVDFGGLEQAEAYFDSCQHNYLVRYCGKLQRETAEPSKDQ